MIQTAKDGRCNLVTIPSKVVRVNGEWMAQVERTEACAKCGACQHGHSQSRLYPLPEGEYREGDTVEISLPGDGAFRASAIAYGIPVAFLLLGLVMGSLLGLPDLGQAALALAALAGGFFALKALEPRIKRSGRFAPRYHCMNKQNLGGHEHGD